MKLIVGLGNPGLRYKVTRHNVGFLILDKFAKQHKIIFNRRHYSSLMGEAKIYTEPVVLLKPQTFMNNSGAVMKSAISDRKTDLEDILIICDDINLELGTIRVRVSGSAGGHRGLNSIIQILGSEDIPRLRVGIGRQKEKSKNLADYVLSDFKRTERSLLKEVLEKSVEAVEVWIKEGIEACMTRFNTYRKR